ncbi:unnamed protein product [Eruca vesicaria subsp. sativa]|uniref:Uncharacterized protein n=1 Tax=Eruca vesicaria subsp. sativa TaxID=29727 RepID=A0ABC8MAA3_ERUVS|nr:unnamed protein product [Eruca vesicaria subsp. sativa]
MSKQAPLQRERETLKLSFSLYSLARLLGPMEAGFTIREYTSNVRSVDIKKCCPFTGEFTGDFIQSLLPPLTVAKFRWWSHELTSLLTKPKPASNAESCLGKKRSIGETTTNDIVLHNKKIKTKKLDDSLHAKTDNKVYNCEELFQDSARSVSQDCGFEFQIPRTLKVATKRKVCSVRSTDASQCESQVRDSLKLCCSQMNRLSLSSAVEDQSRKVMLNVHASDNMVFESTQRNKFQPVVSERRLLSHARAESSLSCFPGPHLTLERVKDALDLERKRHVSQPNQSSNSASLSQPASVAMRSRTLLNQSPFDPFLVEEAISGFPLNLQGDLVEANGSKDTLFPMFCEPPQVGTYVVPDSELPPTLLYPCGSLVSCPLTDKDLYFHEYGLGQQLNSVTFSQKQLPFPYNPEIAGLPSYYSNVGGVDCLLPDAREPSFGLPFTSTTQSQLHLPQFESSRLDMSYINHA